MGLYTSMASPAAIVLSIPQSCHCNSIHDSHDQAASAEICHAYHVNGGMGKLANGAGDDDCGLSVLAKKLGEAGWA